MEIDTFIVSCYYKTVDLEGGIISAAKFGNLVLKFESVFKFCTFEYEISNDLDKNELYIQPIHEPYIKILNHTLLMVNVFNLYIIYEFSRSSCKLKLVSKFLGDIDSWTLEIIQSPNIDIERNIECNIDNEYIGYITRKCSIDIVEIKSKELIKLGEIVIGRDSTSKCKILLNSLQKLAFIYDSNQILIYDLQPIISKKSKSSKLLKLYVVKCIKRWFHNISEHKFSYITSYNDRDKQIIWNIENLHNPIIEESIVNDEYIAIYLSQKNNWNVITYGNYNTKTKQDEFYDMSEKLLQVAMMTKSKYMEPLLSNIDLFRDRLRKIVINLLYHGLFDIIFDYVYSPYILLYTVDTNILLMYKV